MKGQEGHLLIFLSFKIRQISHFNVNTWVKTVSKAFPLLFEDNQALIHDNKLYEICI